ncbi:MAG TPA: antitoxin Xre/MbcA/ParS toxin-binding domain-containing protein [Gemmatimonadota bacterium]|nr:antitoxin Xre/MbcA/ParS toxin-binding domain-containing protein [Gemmatimonadota bacterium]
MATIKELNPARLRGELGVTRKDFARMTGYSERSIASWEGGEEPSSKGLQRLNEVKRLKDALADVMKPEYIADWLKTPNDAFQGLKPLEVIERGEADRIWRMIYYLESGVPST